MREPGKGKQKSSDLVLPRLLKNPNEDGFPLAAANAVWVIL